MAEIIHIDATHPNPQFSRCRETVRAGGVVVYPTDTLYGLGADPKNALAVRRLFEIKGRRVDQPILLLIHDISEVREWADEITPRAELFMKKFWPGPLTLVFKARNDVLGDLTAGTGRVGLRIPGNALTRNLLAFVGSALTGTSANRSGGQDPRSAEEAALAVGGMVDLILDAGSATESRPSTVVDVTSDTPVVLREGAIPAQAFR